MCGIAGIYNLDNSEHVKAALLEEMLQVIDHRGPDERGIYLNKNLGIGSVRLSIIDLKTGQQPLCDSSGKYWIVYNGEIFNYLELRQDLLNAGYEFKTNSDTEVIAAGYSIYGPRFFTQLNGQFAFGIWDKVKQQLILARDRVGICPLFYTRNEEGFYFGSEIKALLKHPSVKTQININSLCHIFTYWSTLTPATIFKNIFEVTPGHYLIINKEGISHQSYWKLEFPNSSSQSKLKLEDALINLDEILTDAVKIRLRADVKVAAYLSGGLDSTTTTALIKKIEPGILNTFSIGFKEKDFDESSFQNEAARYLQTNHKNLDCSNEDIALLFPEVIWHSESPMLRTAPAPMYKLSGFVRSNNIKVVITGEGADEMLAGYDIFKENSIRRFWSKYPDSKYRPLLLKKLYPYIPQITNLNIQTLRFFYGYKLQETNLSAYSHLMRWNNGRHILKYLHSDHKSVIDSFDPIKAWEDIKPSNFDSYGDLSKAQYLESTLFMSGYLLSSQGDRMTMGNSVEGRYPFLDHRLIEFAATLPENFKLRGLNEKYILKKMMAGKIPESVLKRPKQAYRAPINNSFFSKPVQPYIESVLSNKILDEYGLFNSQLVQNLVLKINSTGTASELENMILTGIISSQLLYEYFILGKHPFSLPEPTGQMRIIDES